MTVNAISPPAHALRKRISRSAESSQVTYLGACIGLIEQASIKAVSFDFFDTVVFRKVPRPTDAFYLLGRQLATQGILQPAVSAEEFHGLRIAAEQKARARIAKEVTLDQIYDHMPEAIFLTNNREELIREEIGLERSIIRPYPRALELIDLASELGKQVVITSDTYLPSTFLRGILKEFTDASISSVFASCEYRTGKYEQLFEYVIDHLDVLPHEILHIGDNAQSDIEGARAFGITGYHLPNGCSETWAATDAEASLLGGALACLDPQHGDFGITSLRHRSVHEESPAAPDHHAIYGGNILGPVLTGFSEWVANLATRLRVDHVTCLLREGHLLFKLLEGMVADDVPVSTLSVSRRVMLKASLYEINEATLRALVVGREPPTVVEFLTLLGVLPHEIPDCWHLAERRLDDAEVGQAVISAILRDQRVREGILARSGKLRKGLIAHLRSQLDGMPFDGKDPRRLAVIDIGWNGTIQRHLQKIFDAEGWNIQVIGLYLMTTVNVRSMLLDGHEIYGYLVSSGAPEKDYSRIIRSIEILEQACTPPKGSVVDYTAAGMPIVSPLLASEQQLQQIARIQTGILRFHSLYLSTRESTPVEWASDSVRTRLRKALLRALVHPSLEEVRLFSAWEHDENMTSQRSEGLFSPSHIPFLSYMTPAQFLAVPMNEIYWPFGLAVQCAPELAASVQSIVVHNVDPALLEGSVAGCVAQLYCDRGDGFDAASPVTIPVKRNASGLTYLKFEVRSDAGVVAVRLDPVNRAGVLRIDMVRLSIWQEDLTCLVEKVVSGSQLGCLAHVAGMRQLSLQTYLTGNDPQILFDARTLRLHRASRFFVEVGMAFLENDVKDTGPLSGAVYPPLAGNLDPWLADRMVVGGTGLIETINKVPLDFKKSPAPVAIECGNPISITGWCVDEKGKRASDLVFLMVTDAVGTTRYARAQRRERLDIVNSFASTALSRAGLEASLPSDQFQPGLYRIGIVQVFHDTVVLLGNAGLIEILPAGEKDVLTRSR